MTTSLPHTHIRIRDLSELVAGIPRVLGFPPTDSLVLFTFHRCPDLRLSTTIRVNLPRPEHVPLVVTELTAAIVRNEAVAAIAVVVGETGSEHRELMEMLRMTLADNNILLTHASWVPKVAEGEQWQCYEDPLCTGTVPDPHTSALAAATAVAGHTVYPSREALTAHLAPDSAEALARRRKLLDAYRNSAPGPYSEADFRADLETLGRALDKVTGSRALPTLNDHELARLGVALSQVAVKDECMAIALSDESESAERLWTVLVRALPAPERAEPAFLLAISSYLRGSGVIAALALKITMEADPKHDLAVVLDYALQIGTPPDLLRSMIMAAIASSKEQDESPPPDDDPPWDTTPTEEERLTESQEDRDLTATEQPVRQPTVPPATTTSEPAAQSDSDLDEAPSQRLPVSSDLSVLKAGTQDDGEPGEALSRRPAVSPAVPAGEDGGDLGEAGSRRQAVSSAMPVVESGVDLGEAAVRRPAVSSTVSVVESGGDLDESGSWRRTVSPATAMGECAVQGGGDLGEAAARQPAVSLASSVSEAGAQGGAEPGDAQLRRLVSRAGH